jgi:hypothetical protein
MAPHFSLSPSDTRAHQCTLTRRHTHARTHMQFAQFVVRHHGDLHMVSSPTWPHSDDSQHVHEHWVIAMQVLETDSTLHSVVYIGKDGAVETDQLVLGMLNVFVAKHGTVDMHQIPMCGCVPLCGGVYGRRGCGIRV